MASILFVGSFLAASLLTLLIPLALLIAILVWHTKSIASVPHDPSEGAVHAAGAAEVEGRADADETDPPPARA
jgi:hypothetical protein